jgi:membrane peptidoglycan carboxypeptidase
MLRGPLEDGTATRHGQLDRPAAGKTGTTQSYTNAWFVGYVPQLSVAAWMGPEQPATMEHPACGGPVTGGCLPTMMWRDFMQAAIEHYDLPPEDFAEPPPLPTTTVPDVIGRDVENARTVLERLGFSVETRDVADWRVEGIVVASDPAGGEAAARGSVVLLDVSDGTAAAPTVPDVVGRGLADAERLLADVGLDVRVVTVPVADAERYEVVLAQDPAAGASAVTPAGRFVTVTLEVGRPARAGETPRTFTAGAADG